VGFPGAALAKSLAAADAGWTVQGGLTLGDASARQFVDASSAESVQCCSISRLKEVAESL